MAFDDRAVTTRLNLILLGIYVALVVVASVLIYQRERAATMRLVLEKARSVAGEVMADMELMKSPWYDTERSRTNPAYHDVARRQHLINMIAMKEKYLIDVTSTLKRSSHFRPDETEWRQMTWFRNPHVAETDVVTVEKGDRILLYMRALRMNEQCLRCHGAYAAAPDSVRNLFPPGDSIYGHEDGELVGAVAVRVPMAHVTAEAWETIRRDVTWRSIMFLVIMVAAGVVIRRKIVAPLKEENRQLEADALSGARVSPVAADADVDTIFRVIRSLLERAQEKASLHHEKESLYRTLVYLLPTPLLLLTERGRILDANRAAETWFGLHRTDLKGRELLPMVRDGEALWDWMASARVAGTTRTFATTIQEQDVVATAEVTITVVDPEKHLFMARLSPRAEDL